MTVSLIVAVSQNGVIGAGGKLPWHLPTDLKRFKQLTLGHPILMGRKTYESIGKPLPGRTNIIITRQQQFGCCGAVTAPSLEEAIRLCGDAEEVFVIGGAETYRKALPLADRIYLTLIHQDFKGDTFFHWDPLSWKETFREDHGVADNQPYVYSFLTFERKRLSGNVNSPSFSDLA